MRRFTIHVHPRARSDRVEAADDGRLEVWTRAVPSDGRANEAVTRLVADWLRVPPSAVRLATGFRSRTKVVEVADTA